MNKAFNIALLATMIARSRMSSKKGGKNVPTAPYTAPNIKVLGSRPPNLSKINKATPERWISKLPSFGISRQQKTLIQKRLDFAERKKKETNQKMNPDQLMLFPQMRTQKPIDTRITHKQVQDLLDDINGIYAVDVEINNNLLTAETEEINQFISRLPVVKFTKQLARLFDTWAYGASDALVRRRTQPGFKRNVFLGIVSMNINPFLGKKPLFLPQITTASGLKTQKRGRANLRLDVSSYQSLKDLLLDVHIGWWSDIDADHLSTLSDTIDVSFLQKLQIRKLFGGFGSELGLMTISQYASTINKEILRRLGKIGRYGEIEDAPILQSKALAEVNVRLYLYIFWEILKATSIPELFEKNSQKFYKVQIKDFRVQDIFSGDWIAEYLYQDPGGVFDISQGYRQLMLQQQLSFDSYSAMVFKDILSELFPVQYEPASSRQSIILEINANQMKELLIRFTEYTVFNYSLTAKKVFSNPFAPILHNMTNDLSEIINNFQELNKNLDSLSREVDNIDFLLELQKKLFADPPGSAWAAATTYINELQKTMQKGLAVAKWSISSECEMIKSAQEYIISNINYDDLPQYDDLDILPQEIRGTAPIEALIKNLFEFDIDDNPSMVSEIQYFVEASGIGTLPRTPINFEHYLFPKEIDPKYHRGKVAAITGRISISNLPEIMYDANSADAIENILRESNDHYTDDTLFWFRGVIINGILFVQEFQSDVAAELRKKYPKSKDRKKFSADLIAEQRQPNFPIPPEDWLRADILLAFTVAANLGINKVGFMEAEASIMTVGGERKGQEVFYNNIVPQRVKSVAKKYKIKGPTIEKLPFEPGTYDEGGKTSLSSHVWTMSPETVALLKKGYPIFG